MRNLNPHSDMHHKLYQYGCLLGVCDFVSSANGYCVRSALLLATLANSA